MITHLTVITFKRHRSVRIALDARYFNQAIDKDEYQMPNLEDLMDMVAEKLDNEEGEAWYSSFDSTNEYGQVLLDALTDRHCSFQIKEGELTDTYRFNNGFFGRRLFRQNCRKLWIIW